MWSLPLQTSMRRKALYSFEAVQGKGYQDLISFSKKHHVKQFIYCAVPVTPHDNAVPHFRYNRLIEERLKDSGLNFTIIRSAPFMECWFSFMRQHHPGSRIGSAIYSTAILVLENCS